jgi:hypothetical protein
MEENNDLSMENTGRGQRCEHIDDMEEDSPGEKGFEGFPTAVF